MRTERFLIVGANGELGRHVLQALGPDKAIAGTRGASSPLPGFDHRRLNGDGTVTRDHLTDCTAIINAAGIVKGTSAEIRLANVDLPISLARAAQAASIRKMVHVSSFSVYGRQELINASTETNAQSSYGRSKLAADKELTDLAKSGIAIECVRLPLLFSQNRPGLLRPLLKLAQATRALPELEDKPVRRSMITYSSAAKQLAECVISKKSGVSWAADPEPFEFARFAETVSSTLGITIRMITVPGFAAALVNRIAPPVGHRLLRSSLLDPACNLAASEHSELYDQLAQWLKK